MPEDKIVIREFRHIETAVNQTGDGETYYVEYNDGESGFLWMPYLHLQNQEAMLIDSGNAFGNGKRRIRRKIPLESIRNNGYFISCVVIKSAKHLTKRIEELLLEELQHNPLFIAYSATQKLGEWNVPKTLDSLISCYRQIVEVMGEDGIEVYQNLKTLRQYYASNA